MALIDLFILREAPEGVPQPVDDDPYAQDDERFAAGSGPTSNGIPMAVGGQQQVPTLGGGTAPTQMLPARQNAGGTGGPPQQSGPFAQAPNSPQGPDRSQRAYAPTQMMNTNQEEPLPNLPLEAFFLPSK